MSKKRKAGGTDSANWILLSTAFVAACTAFWLFKVSEVVTEPYLDEVFHVRQAQVYCYQNFKVWDPKITTPPGLYLISWLIFKITGQCSITALRTLNAGTLVISTYLTYSILLQITSSASGSKAKTRWSAVSAANVWLFPPIFFFSGLYYTDVQSALWVLLAFHSHLESKKDGYQSLPVGQFTYGLAALLFRQTNIFWVAVFPAGLTVVEVLRKCARPSSRKATAHRRDAGLVEVCQKSWNESTIFDPPVEDAWIEDYLKTVLSIAIVALHNLPKLFLPLAPHVSLLAAFGAFVFWNGGVVLGDKSNHVATIHLPQMLYLWPYMIFFSLPLVVPTIINSAVTTLTNKPNAYNALRRIATFTAATVLAAAGIHYNTIVHPFTLADNRHYVFYVFRLLLRRPAIRYLAAPVYILSANITIQALGSQRASFAIIWIATTALSLITAPLVEPRYCIIPWIMWRLHVKRTDGRLLGLETLWFCVVNAVTGYVFLYRGFEWPQEAGKVQRFMW